MCLWLLADHCYRLCSGHLLMNVLMIVSYSYLVLLIVDSQQLSTYFRNDAFVHCIITQLTISTFPCNSSQQ